LRVLVVEDNPILRENLLFLLKKFHYTPDQAENGEVALMKAKAEKYDAVVLDINMPVMTGKEFLLQFRKFQKDVPVIALSSDGLLEDKLSMFDLGVDDYLTKPFEIEELTARLKSLLKRKKHTVVDIKKIGNYEIDYGKRKVFMDGEEISFPHKQYLILELLSKNLDYPQSKTTIMSYVWWDTEEKLDLDSTTLESHIYAIRKKLWKSFIKTITGTGYVIEDI